MSKWKLGWLEYLSQGIEKRTSDVHWLFDSGWFENVESVRMSGNIDHIPFNFYSEDPDKIYTFMVGLGIRRIDTRFLRCYELREDPEEKEICKYTHSRAYIDIKMKKDYFKKGFGKGQWEKDGFEKIEDTTDYMNVKTGVSNRW